MESPKNLMFGKKSYRDVLCSPAPTKTDSILRENRFSSSFSDAVCKVEVEAVAPVELILPPSPMKPDENQFSDALCEGVDLEALLCEEVEAVAPVELLLPPSPMKPDENQLSDALCEEVEAVAPVVASRDETIAQELAKLVPDPKEYAEFRRQFFMSDGFDLDRPTHKCVGIPAIFDDMDELDKDVHREATYCAKFAISFHNKQHEEEEKSKLDFVELVKLNLKYSCGTTYYLTFKARNGDGVVSVYQAKVYYEEDEETKILIFREKPSSYPEIKRVEKKHGCAKKVFKCGKKIYDGSKKHERDMGCACCGCNC